MTEHRKITAFIPADLLARAQANSGASLTETLKIALDEYNRGEWYRQALDLAGKVNLDLDLVALRKDREFDEGGKVVD
ncbi:MAG: hypothetical protein ABI242_12010 [Caulobacteraceae bacterium]